MSEKLKEKLDGVSTGPGVYLMKDADNKVIYVGKAANLKKRLGSYFKNSDKLDVKTGVLVKNISTYETIVTESEKEAFLLEENLIKKFKPRYNVILKDDKRYPSLRLDRNEKYPGLSIVRKTLKKPGILYFGPFPSSHAVRQTLKIIDKTFKLRKCKTGFFMKRTRPCLNYQMKRCHAPCCLQVHTNEYNEIINEVILFLNGNAPKLIHKIRSQMIRASDNKEYEKAAALRDKILSIEKSLEKQIMVTTDFVDRDVLALARQDSHSVMTILNIRGGALLGTRHYHLNETLPVDDEIFSTFIRQYYAKTPFVPKEVLVPVSPEDSHLLEEMLHLYKGQKVNLMCPQRGKKVKLVEMAKKNAENHLQEIISDITSDMELLSRLRRQLKINRMPVRIECYDNSNISGTEPVAGMVVFENGKPKKSSYRKYRLKNVKRPNDYEYMKEVLKRRFRKQDDSIPYPDLLMVDGGKGQMNIAVSVLQELNLEHRFQVIGIAKKDVEKGETKDKIYRPGRANPLNLGKRGDLLLFLQRIRDEAHRFAIAFHRNRRTKKSIHSELDDVPGVGLKRKTILLKHFGSIKKIRAATLEDLSVLPGMNEKVAKELKNRLNEL